MNALDIALEQLHISSGAVGGAGRSFQYGSVIFPA